MITRRTLNAAMASSVFVAHSTAHSQASNTLKPVRLIVPVPAGGALDQMARLVGERVRPRWPQGLVVDNRAGANSIVAAEAVLAQPKDGNTLLVTNSITFVAPYVTNRPGFHPQQDLVAVAELCVEQLVVYVRSDSRFTSLGQLVEQEKRSAGSVNFGSYGIGTNGHLLLVALNSRAGMNMMHVPYKSSALLANAVIGGEVQIGIAPYSFAKTFFDGGRLKPIAVFGDARVSTMPAVPTLQESDVPGFEFSAWTGVFAARGTPQAILQRLAADFQAGLSEPGFRAGLKERGTEPGSRILDDFDRIVHRDAELLGKMNVAAGIRLE